MDDEMLRTPGKTLRAQPALDPALFGSIRIINGPDGSKMTVCPSDCNRNSTATFIYRASQALRGEISIARQLRQLWKSGKPDPVVVRAHCPVLDYLCSDAMIKHVASNAAEAPVATTVSVLHTLFEPNGYQLEAIERMTRRTGRRQ